MGAFDAAHELERIKGKEGREKLEKMHITLVIEALRCISQSATLALDSSPLALLHYITESVEVSRGIVPLISKEVKDALSRSLIQRDISISGVKMLFSCWCNVAVGGDEKNVGELIEFIVFALTVPEDKIVGLCAIDSLWRVRRERADVIVKYCRKIRSIEGVEEIDRLLEDIGGYYCRERLKLVGEIEERIKGLRK